MVLVLAEVEVVVCIYNRTLDKHLEHMCLVIQGFKDEGLKLRLKKCLFGL
jgi:hypothetical protein